VSWSHDSLFHPPLPVDASPAETTATIPVVPVARPQYQNLFQQPPAVEGADDDADLLPDFFEHSAPPVQSRRPRQPSHRRSGGVHRGR
jgi:hypothetical protein